MSFWSDDRTFSKAAARRLTLLSAALFLLLLLWPGVSPEANDDAGIAQLLSDPSCSWVPFISPILAAPVRALMQNVPIVNWWSVALFLFALLGWAGCFYPLARTLPRQLCLCLSLPLLFTFYRLTAYCLTFTRSAVAIAAGGGMLCLFAVFSSAERRERVWCYVLGCLFVMLGVTMRRNGGLLAVVFLGVAVLCCLMRQVLADRSRASLRKAFFRGVQMLVVAGLALGIGAAGRAMTGPEEREYSAFQSQRSAVIDYRDDYPAWEENSEAYLAAGISRMDFEFSRNWNSYDTELVTADTLKSLVSFREPAPASAFLQSLYHRLQNYGLLLLVLTAAVFLLCDPRRYLPPLLLSFAAAAAVVVYYGLSGRLPQRVFDSVALSAVMLALGAGALAPSECSLPEQTPGRRIRRLLPGIGGAALLILALLTAPAAQSPAGSSDSSRAEVLRYLSEQDGVFFSLTNGCMPSRQTIGPWVCPTPEDSSNVFPMGGWVTRTPWMTARLARFGITNPVRDLTERDDVFAEYHITLLRFVQEHYGEDITASRAMSLPEGVCDELTFAAYLHTVPDGEPAEVRLSPVERETDADFGEVYAHWRFSGTLAAPAPAGQRLYCNADICGGRRTFAVDLAEDSSFTAEFYALPAEAEPAEANFVFFFL